MSKSRGRDPSCPGTRLGLSTAPPICPRGNCRRREVMMILAPGAVRQVEMDHSFADRTPRRTRTPRIAP